MPRAFVPLGVLPALAAFGALALLSACSTPGATSARASLASITDDAHPEPGLFATPQALATSFAPLGSASPDPGTPQGGPDALYQATPDEQTVAADDHDWNRRLIDPVTAPYIFESPLIHTSARPIYIRHNIPRNSILGGGNLKAYALQLRWAVTDRFAVIAVKDGRIDFEASAVPHETGWTDIAGGIKYAFIDDPRSGTIVTGGLIYEMHNGSTNVFQGNGSGAYRPFVSAGWDQGPVNVISSVGAHLPIDGDAESQSVDYHLHVSYEATEKFLPLVEVNGISYTNNGRALPVNQEAVDYGNLGSANVDGNDVITAAIGFRYRLTDDVDFGMAWEEPITERKDIFESRFMFDFVTRF